MVANPRLERSDIEIFVDEIGKNVVEEGIGYLVVWKTDKCYEILEKNQNEGSPTRVFGDKGQIYSLLEECTEGRDYQIINMGIEPSSYKPAKIGAASAK